MLYSFDINLTEQDHYDFNKFYLLKTHYGKKQTSGARILVTIIPLVWWLAICLLNGFNKENLALVIIFALLSTGFCFLSDRVVWTVTKAQLKKLYKTGRPPYTPVSTLEFYENCFIEKTPDNKIESNYILVDSVYIANGKMIYIFVNSVLAYMIPVSAFESDAQYNEFFKFLIQKTGKEIIVK